MHYEISPHPSPWAEAPETIIQALGGNADHGLSEAESHERLGQHGYNVLHEAKPRSRLAAFLLQFADWMIGLLVAAAVVSVAIGEWPDALLIGGIVLANGAIGYVQEQKAERAVSALKKLSQPIARVWRAGRLSELPASMVVPGDLIELRGGDLAAADGRLIRAVELQTDESPLTGESMPVDKHVDTLPNSTPLPDRANMVYAGTAVARGRGKIIVSATGMRTELGRIASLLETAKVVQTPLQKRMQDFSKHLALAIVGVCGVVFALGLIRSEDTPQHMFLVAVSLAVAAIPEGLPAVITIALALGSQRMSRRNAIVRQLSAVETLGSVDVICTDKTGTLTQNKMSVSDWRPHRDDPAIVGELVRAAVLCNDAQPSNDGQIVGSATEAALLTAAHEAYGTDIAALRGQWRRTIEFPFNSQRKRMSTVHQSPDGEQVVYVKGAAEMLLDRCTQLYERPAPRPLGADERRRLEEVVSHLADRGCRVLASARRSWDGESIPQSADEVETDLALLGFVGIIDPPRPEARDAIARCRMAGIRPVMITGDHRQTAVAIAKNLSLWDENSEVVGGEALEKLTDEELRGRAERVSVFARVSPEHKLRIVRAYQSLNSVVSMTGDGVNDAPALKQADIGVSMGISGADVSKQAARMVLADDNFATIVAAVEEGRAVYNNIRKFVQYLLTANLSEILLVALAIVFGLPLPLLPVQLLWINLVTDGLPALALALAYEEADQDLMRRPPRRREETILAGGLARDIILFGTFMGTACLALYAYFLTWGNPPGQGVEPAQYARTAVFVSLAMFQLFFVFGLHSADRSIVSSPPWRNWRLVGAFLAGTVLQIAIVYVPFLQLIFHAVPLRAIDLAATIAVSTTALLAFEITKALRRSRRMHSGPAR